MQASASACRAVALPTADAPPSRVSTMPSAAGSISRMAAPSASSALCQPSAVIRYSDAGSRANWPKLPAAPAMPSAWLRWFGAKRRPITPDTTENVQHDSAVPIVMPEVSASANGVVACAMP